MTSLNLKKELTHLQQYNIDVAAKHYQSEKIHLHTAEINLHISTNLDLTQMDRSFFRKHKIAFA
jgi:hypothetical protein